MDLETRLNKLLSREFFVPIRSPWGKVQEYQHITPWLVKVHTASHGGYKVSKHKNDLIPSKWRSKNGWYEEDMEWSIIFYHLAPNLISDYCHGSIKIKDFKLFYELGKQYCKAN